MRPTCKKHYQLLLAIGAFASTVLAQTSGTFTATGNMTTPRFGHTATLLLNGKVLIAGGRHSSGYSWIPLASAELYDPSTGAFAATGDMTSARWGHSATLLPDGKVLIAGGGWPAILSRELYDPSTGTFTSIGEMEGAGAAVLLANGKVLIAHDRNGGASPAAAELYDPVAGTFSATGNQLVIWAGRQQAALLADGRVLLLICCTAEQLYDPASGAFSLTGATTNGYQDGFASALLMSGKVLRAGGYFEEGNAATAGAELYDPSTGIFAATGGMTTGRYSFTATTLADGTVLIAGSWPDFGIDSASAELYDPSTEAFTATGEMTTGRSGHTATLLLDGTVLMAGGQVSDFGLFSAELYHPPVPVPAPALLSLSGDGQGQGAVQHAGTTRIASADDPAVAGEYLSIYLNGLTDGSVIPPQVAIGGRLAEITFFGSVPGYPRLDVVNIRMPSGVAPGPAVPVRLTYLGRSSNQVTIGVALDAGLQQGVTAMKTAARTDSLNFWQWAWYWQNLPVFSGAPAGFGVVGSISPDVMEQIIIAGGGDALRNISAEQWILYFRQVVR